MCQAEDNEGQCGVVCSNANTDLSMYGLCSGSEVCGQDYLYISPQEYEKLTVVFTDPDQLCVYKIIEAESLVQNLIPSA